MKTVSFRLLFGKRLPVRLTQPAPWSLRRLKKAFFNPRKVVRAPWSCHKPHGRCKNQQKKPKFEETREFFLYLSHLHGTTMENLWLEFFSKSFKHDCPTDSVLVGVPKGVVWAENHFSPKKNAKVIAKNSQKRAFLPSKLRQTQMSAVPNFSSHSKCKKWK